MYRNRTDTCIENACKNSKNGVNATMPHDAKNVWSKQLLNDSKRTTSILCEASNFLKTKNNESTRCNTCIRVEIHQLMHHT